MVDPECFRKSFFKFGLELQLSFQKIWLLLYYDSKNSKIYRKDAYIIDDVQNSTRAKKKEKNPRIDFSKPD